MRDITYCVEEKQESYQTSWLEDNQLSNTERIKVRLEMLLEELGED